MVGVVFGRAPFREAFLILRAQNVGLSLTWVPIVLVGMNVVYALSAYPAGVLSDRLNRKALLAAGVVLLARGRLAGAPKPHPPRGARRVGRCRPAQCVLSS